MVLSYTGVAKKIKFKIICTPHSTQYFVVLLCHLLSTNNHLNPPFTNEDEKKKKTIEITGRIPLTTQVQYTHTKSISCLEGSDAIRCKHIAKTVHLVTKCSLTFQLSCLFFQFLDFFFSNNLSWFPPMYKSTMKPLNVHTWFAVDFICGTLSTMSNKYPRHESVL